MGTKKPAKAAKKFRKDRSDITVASLEKKHGMPPGTVRNPGGRDTRGDKKLGTIRKEAGKKGEREVKKLQTGFTFDSHAGATYSFEHMPLADAEGRARTAETPHIVEAINWTTSEGGEVHYNRYYAHDFDEAIGLAVRLRIGFEEGVEEVVAIRPATKSEASAGGKASSHFLELMPLAISTIDHNEESEEGEKR